MTDGMPHRMVERTHDGMTDRGNVAAAIAFILVFPAFIAYQVLVQAGVMAPSLGGYGTAGAAAALPFALYAFYRQAGVHGFAPTPTGALFVVYLLMFSTFVFFGGTLNVDPEVTGPHAAYIFKFVVWYLIARSVDADSPRFKLLGRLLLVGVIGLVIWMAVTRQSFAAVLRPMMPGEDPGDYQGSAMVFIALAAYTIPSMRFAARIPAYALSTLTLFLVGARSEFVGFILLIIVVEWCKAKSRPLMTLLMVAAAVAFLGAVKGIEANPDANRIFGLLSVANDESAILRGEMAAEAWVTVWENPVMGAYASYPPGEYAHNLVSAWVDFGVIGFVLLLSLLAIPLAGLAMRFASDSRRDDFIRTLALAAVVTLLMAVAKTHTYQLLGVSLGLYARYRVARRARLLAAA